MEVGSGRLCRSEAFAGRLRSLLVAAVAALCCTSRNTASHGPCPGVLGGFPGQVADARQPGDFLRHTGSKRMSVRTVLWLVGEEWCRHPMIMSWAAGSSQRKVSALSTREKSASVFSLPTWLTRWLVTSSVWT